MKSSIPYNPQVSGFQESIPIYSFQVSKRGLKERPRSGPEKTIQELPQRLSPSPMMLDSSIGERLVGKPLLY